MGIQHRKFEIEISSFCNRKCDWCTNKIFLRDTHEIMSDALFLKIISEMQSAGLNRKDVSVSFSKFNEPTADMNLLKRRVEQLRQYLPEVELKIYTNGDYIIDDAITKLDINLLLITDYDNKGKNAGYAIMRKLGAKRIFNMGNRIFAEVNNIKLYFRYDWTDYPLIEDRGNLLTSPDLKYKNNRDLRVLPCPIQNRPISIDYKGNLLPCCHMRSESPMHQKFIMGDLNTETLNDILNNKKFADFNHTMSQEDSALFFPPCERCHKYSYYDNK